MAAKGDPLQLDRKTGDYTTCLPCSEAERVTEAIRYCVECKSHLCEQCLQDHNKFASLRKHHTVDKSEIADHLEETDQSKANTEIECGSHYGQYIDTYCKDHDEVCCSICVTIKHRSCKQTEKILQVAKGIKKSKEISDTKLSLEQFLAYVNQEKVDRNKNLTSLDEEKTQILSDIDKFEENIIKRTREIAETSRENIRDAHAKHVNAVKSDVKELDTVMSGLKECLNKLNKTNINKVEAFVGIKNCQKTLAEMKKVVNDLSDKWLQTELCYEFNNKMIHKNTAFGNVIEEEKKDTVCRLTCKREVNIRHKMDISTCTINGICQLADGTYVIIDSSNANIKKLTDNLESTDFIKLDGNPRSICVTGPKEAAVTLPEKNLIQLVEIDESLSLGTSFSTAPGHCTAINYDSREEKFYVCCTHVIEDKKPEKRYCTISVYSKNGKQLTTFKKDIEGQTICIEPQQIFLETERILVLDKDLKVLILRKTAGAQLELAEGQYLSRFSYQMNWYSRQNCLCLLSKNVMLSVSGYRSKGMSLNSMDGTKIKSLQMETSSTILTAVFNKQRSTLLVAGESDEIKEYKVPIKILKLLE
ncbi:uncharacterized protein LOC123549851 [Mercenaria mercenaria]|uniref:uncharacterized protein LOC123549851 n=1 Tax=Mercenaria mercenaria TaxID=6596 RepID=UPI00234F379B|nr:uncharacterized protein LOC123549851 [Mercenaria mercenaria]